MKRLSLVMSLIFIFTLLPHFLVTVDAEATTTTEYNIEIETLADTVEAKELNKYRKKFLNYLNKQAQKENNALGSNSYKLLELTDLDFTDNSKISGIKKHSHYSEYEFSATYDEFIKDLEADNYWCLNIIKDNTLFDVEIFKSDNPEKYSDKAYKIGDGWYIKSCWIYLKEQNWTSPLIYDNNIIRANLEKLLNKYDVKSKNIKVIYTAIGKEDYWSTCAVIFVDDIAKYIYADTFFIPDHKLESDTPQKIRDILSDSADELFSGTKANPIETTDIYRLRHYNEIMSLFRLYEAYAEK